MFRSWFLKCFHESSSVMIFQDMALPGLTPVIVWQVQLYALQMSLQDQTGIFSVIISNRWNSELSSGREPGWCYRYQSASCISRRHSYFAAGICHLYEWCWLGSWKLRYWSWHRSRYFTSGLCWRKDPQLEKSDFSCIKSVKEKSR